MMTNKNGEIIWVSYSDTSGHVKWRIASDPMRVHYILYKVYGKEMKKVKSSKSPADFEEIIGMPV